MELKERLLSQIVDVEARSYAMYTIQNRAIPNMVDGLKPVQRFFLYSALQNAKTNFTKVAALSGRVSEMGYHHGEGSAADAGQLMANTWNNNLPIIQGRGNFGSRMVKKAAAPRYTFCKLHENFFKYFRDNHLTLVHKDPEHMPPQFYLPTIPFVLLNGVKGIATGFATDILPHSVKDVVRATVEYVKTGKITKEPAIHFPEFKGKVVQKDGRSFIEGNYEFNGKTKFIITEIPYKYDREAYVTILNELEDQGKIASYDDKCGEDGFRFEVNLKRDFFLGQKTTEHHELFVKVFKLRQGISQNLTVIGPNEDLREYTKASDLIRDFVDIRKTFIENRIKVNIKKTKEDYDLSIAKVLFIESVLDDRIVIQNKTRKQALTEIKNNTYLKNYAEKLITMNIYHMTKDEIVKLKKDAAAFKKEHSYWLKTDTHSEYLKDLKELG